MESVILIIGIVQGTFLILTLVAKSSPKQKVNQYLVLLLVTFVIALCGQLLLVSGYAEKIKHLFVITTSVIFLFGPLLYCYIKSLISPNIKIPYFAFFHLLPFFCYLIFVIHLSFFSAVELEIVTDHPVNRYSFMHWLLPAIKFSHVAFYTVGCLVILMRYARRVEENFSNIDSINLLWLRNLVIGFILFEVAVISTIIFNLNSLADTPNADAVLSLFLVLLIFMTGFYGMHQPAILERPLELDIDKKNTKEKKEDGGIYYKNLSGEDIAIISARLDELKSQEIYLDRFLNLRMLSDLVGVSHHKMSEFLNTQMKMTFYEFVNRSRVSNAKQRLIDSQESILDIALQVGFNNKATFNKAFKNFESMTPSDFRRQNRN
jgi:AraC-like DNA-binding protein